MFLLLYCNICHIFKFINISYQVISFHDFKFLKNFNFDFFILDELQFLTSLNFQINFSILIDLTLWEIFNFSMILLNFNLAILNVQHKCISRRAVQQQIWQKWIIGKGNFCFIITSHSNRSNQEMKKISGSASVHLNLN